MQPCSALHYLAVPCSLEQALGHMAIAVRGVVQRLLDRHAGEPTLGQPIKAYLPCVEGEEVRP